MRWCGLPALLLLASPVVANIVDADEIDESYDFVIVGGGLAGLVLGSRLSEDAQHSVLVLEAGPTGDEQADLINIPANTYYEDMWDTPINWQFHTVPQPNVNGTGLIWPRGKVLGGSSAINGLYFTRPGEKEIETWNGMLGDMDGADNWTWDILFAAMKKSQTFNPPSSDIASQAAIKWDTASQGTSGPISASYPGFMLDATGDWCTANAAAGVNSNPDTYGGENWGCYISTSAINPANWTRSYSRSGYLDALPPRKNYAVLANAQVTRILFDDSDSDKIAANAVEYTTDGATMLKVKVAKEVILAGGSVGSPTVLMYSGVGPKDVLDAASVEVVHDLPGVGEHLQDHLSVYTQWKTNVETAGDMYKDGNRDPAFMSLINDAVAYADAGIVLGADAVSDFVANAQNSLNQYAPAESTVAEGYNAISKASLGLFDSEIGQIELLMGTNGEGAISLGASIQHPLSQGRITIASSNPVEDPVIDPMYLTNPADAEVLVAGLKLVRKIGESAPFSNYLTESWPGDDVQTDEQWDKWMRGNVFTNYHPASTCAMLPLEQGGVVDGNLRVYGLSNVRVADASVPPFVFSAHLMSSTYGIAEQASTIIRNEWKKREQAASALAVHSASHRKDTTTTQNSDDDDNSSDDNENSDNDSNDNKDRSQDTKDNGAAGNRPSLSIAAFVTVITYAIFAF